MVLATEGHAELETDVRSISPRRSLPSGRAVIGAVLITVAAVGAFALARVGSDEPSTRFLVVVRPVKAGDTVSTADLDLVPIDLPARVAATALGPASLTEATALRDLRPGELLTDADLLPSGGAPPSVHELTIPVANSRVDSAIVSGDRVTILATIRTVDSNRTVVAVEDVEVLRWSDGDDGIGGSPSGVLTLALDRPEEVLALTHLLGQGDTTVVRTTRAVDDVYPPHYPPNAASDGLTLETGSTR